MDDTLLGRLFSDQLALPDSGEPPLRAIPSHGGVCALTGEDDAIIQVLTTQSLRRTLTTRLARKPDEPASRRASVAGVVRRVWWLPAYSPFEASWAYLRIARQLFPRSYRKELAFSPAWCACIELDAPWPQWSVRNAPFAPGLVATGPFTTRKRCAAYIEALEDIFDLCRDYEILRKAPNGQRCAYFDMGKCPAPCDGTVSPAAYRASIDASVRFATGNPNDVVQHLHAKMEDAAKSLAFEVAERFRQKLDRAEQLVRKDERLMHLPHDARYLILQRGRTRSFVKPFFFQGGLIETGCDAPRKNLDGAAESWLSRTWSSDKSETYDANYRTECLWLVAHYIAKPDHGRSLFIPASGDLSAVDLVERIESVILGRNETT